MEKEASQSDILTSPTLTGQQHYWQQHLQSYQASGKSMAEYAREHELAVKSFYYWKKRLLRLNAMVSDTRTKSPVFHKVPGFSQSQDSVGPGFECRLLDLIPQWH
jgi:hypothetical protein